jgi:hypothetical protein
MAEQGQVHPRMLAEIDSIVIELISAKMVVRYAQVRHGRFLAGAPLLPPPHLSNSQNLAKDQALAALPPVAALMLFQTMC